jgi:hypothetical protein
MKRLVSGKSKVLLRNGANILKITIYEPFILNFSILGLTFHNLSKKCLNRFTDVVCFALPFFGVVGVYSLTLRRKK